uniref:UTP14A small subunit processome component n=1 Tax=Nothoprocta perdicaria TaxID=30464 RepID=A0A8C6Z3E8_NOTPE
MEKGKNKHVVSSASGLQPRSAGNTSHGQVLQGLMQGAEEDGERRHRQLLEAVSSLSGRRRRKLAERTEASAQVSEFNVSCEGAGEKLVLSELLQPIKPKSALSSVKRELTKVKQKKAVELPLSKEEAERVVREAAYVKSSKDVSKWQQVVLQNRRAEQLVFPLKQEIAAVAPLEQVVSGWKARTPLEQEIFGLLHKTHQPITDPLLTPRERASLQAMSLEEARQRRAELQKARALQSYYEAKARREKKIKSKKYHRVLKKSKKRKALKEFELLQKSDPEAALARLEELEQLRMEERMSLKHQNKGKWARSRAIMAKYDLEARKAMQEQLAKNKELMQKVRLEPPEEEAGDVPAEEPVPESVPMVPMNAGGANPWMLGKPSSPVKEPEVQEALGDVAEPAAVESKEEMEEEEEEVSEEEALLQHFEQKRHVRRPPATSPTPCNGPLMTRSECGLLCAVGHKQASVGIEQPSQAQEEVLLSEQPSRVRTMEDIEALASEERAEEQEIPVAAGTEKRVRQQQAGRADTGRTKKPRKARKKETISLQAVLSGKPQEEGGVDQRGVITEAFAGDDVVADFRREKRKAEQAGKPQPVNLVLPGWGEWGGTGLKPSKRKMKRCVLPSCAVSLQVSELPFPFEEHQQFERSIRTPMGSTWNTQRAFQKLTAPHVVTRAGHIIQPIAAEDVPSLAAQARSEALELPPKQREPSSRPPRPRKRAR